MTILNRRQQKTAEVKDGGKKFRATMVTPEPRPTIDEKRLLASLSDKEIDAVTVRKLDRAAMEARMDTHPEFIDKVVPCTVLKPVAPHLRFTEGVNDDFEE